MMVDRQIELYMKNLMRSLNILILLIAAVSCTDNIPRGRPTLELSDSTAVTDTDTETEEEVDLITQRPSGAIIIQPDACACQNGKPISIGDCADICAAKQASTNANKTFFFDVELTEAITLDVYQDIAGWCSTLDGETDVVNSCYYEIKSESGSVEQVAFDPAAGATSFQLDLSGEILSEDETYRITLVESATSARSTTIQLRLYSDLLDDTIGGPLAIMPVNSYSCLFRDGEFDSSTGELIVNDTSRFHFYFIPSTRPEPLSEATVPTVNCYDIETYGNTPINSPFLEETNNSFAVWNSNDPRFFDLSSTGVLRVHELIEQNVELQGQSLSSTPELFFPLSWLNGFNDGDQNPGEEASVSISTTSAELGYYMSPFIDSETYKAYCPTRSHYYSDSVLFKAMREIVGVDTEALYVAKQQNVCDFLLIKESTLKDIWFYIEGGQHIEPTNDTVQGKQIQFYWPADPNSPFIKKSYQRTYTVKNVSDISCNDTSVGSGSQGSDGVRTQIPPHDNRIGCIPVLSE